MLAPSTSYTAIDPRSCRRDGPLLGYIVLSHQLRRRVELRLVLSGDALSSERELMQIFLARLSTVQRGPAVTDELPFIALRSLIRKWVPRALGLLQLVVGEAAP